MNNNNKSQKTDIYNRKLEFKSDNFKFLNINVNKLYDAIIGLKEKIKNNNNNADNLYKIFKNLCKILFRYCIHKDLDINKFQKYITLYNDYIKYSNITNIIDNSNSFFNKNNQIINYYLLSNYFYKCNNYTDLYYFDTKLNLECNDIKQYQYYEKANNTTTIFLEGKLTDDIVENFKKSITNLNYFIININKSQNFEDCFFLISLLYDYLNRFVLLNATNTSYYYKFTSTTDKNTITTNTMDLEHTNNKNEYYYNFDIEIFNQYIFNKQYININYLINDLIKADGNNKYIIETTLITDKINEYIIKYIENYYLDDDLLIFFYEKLLKLNIEKLLDETNNQLIIHNFILYKDRNIKLSTKQMIINHYTSSKKNILNSEISNIIFNNYLKNPKYDTKNNTVIEIMNIIIKRIYNQVELDTKYTIHEKRDIRNDKKNYNKTKYVPNGDLTMDINEIMTKYAASVIQTKEHKYLKINSIILKLSKNCSDNVSKTSTISDNGNYKFINSSTLHTLTNIKNIIIEIYRYVYDKKIQYIYSKK